MSTTVNPMAGKPVTSKVAGLTVSFKPTIKAYVLHNAKRKQKDTFFAGNKITIPPCNEIGPYAETDADGDKIPGTRVVTDIYTYQDHLGVETLTMDAEKAIIHILGIEPDNEGNASKLTSSFAIGGVSLFPRTPSKQVWYEIAKQGEIRAFWAAVAAAEYTIMALDAANAIRKQAGKEPIPGGFEYEQARQLLIQRDQVL